MASPIDRLIDVLLLCHIFLIPVVGLLFYGVRTERLRIQEERMRIMRMVAVSRGRRR